MQKTENEFDQLVRSMLADAAEEVPAGVWEAVSSRTAAPRSRAAYWRWAGAGIAAAAMLGFGIFFAGTFNNSNTPDISIATADSSPTIAIQTNNQNTILAEARPLASGDGNLKAQALRPAAAVILEPEAEQVETTVSTGQAIIVTDQRTQPAAEQQAAPAKPSQQVKEETFTDPFAALPEEEVRSARFADRLSITAEGSVIGNESSGNATYYHTSGSGASVEGISEKSISTYGIPVSFGVGIRFGLTDRLSIGSGLEWTMLSRSFSGTYTSAAGIATPGDINHNLQYIGIPVDLFLNVVNGKTVNVYTYAGGKVEYCLSSKYHMYSANPAIVHNEAVSGVQPSLSTGIGVEFKLSKLTSIYFDPGISYYFPCNQPKSIRTDKSFLIDFSAGLRFNL